MTGSNKADDVPYQLDLEEAACCRYQSDLPDLGAECREELLPKLLRMSLKSNSWWGGSAYICGP